MESYLLDFSEPRKINFLDNGVLFIPSSHVIQKIYFTKYLYIYLKILTVFKNLTVDFSNNEQ